MSWIITRPINGISINGDETDGGWRNGGSFLPVRK